MRDQIYLLLFLLSGGSFFSQSHLNYVWPIDSALSVTGNYGELRPNHFHAGIDFSTAGKMNLPVYSIEEGYISRVRVGPYGYGKCIYVTHPNGKVSVYAHLNSFSLKAANLVKEHQYATQSSEIDFMPKPRSTYVRRNEIIGLSGNTGSSTGPHLHFEIRDEKSEVPLNPLLVYNINDKLAPEVNAISFYNLGDTSAPSLLITRRVRQVANDSLVLESDKIVVPESIIGLAFSGFDRCKIRGSMNNIFSVRIFVNEELIYEHQLNGIGFSESRYINEFSEKIGKYKFQKCFLPTVYPEGLYGTCINKGRLFLSDTGYSKIKYEFTDEYGNRSPLQFYLKAKQLNTYKVTEQREGFFVNCLQDFSVSNSEVQLYIPAKSLFYSGSFVLESSLDLEGKLSVLPRASLGKPVKVGFKVPARLWPKREQLILKGGSSYFPLVRGDSIFFDVKEFGNFNLLIDTVPPVIKTIYSEKKLKDAWKMDSFSFYIGDKQSGIGEYNLWLNNSWVPVEYDAKTDLLTYYFDEETPIGLLNFKLEVTDRSGNSTFLEYVLKK